MYIKRVVLEGVRGFKNLDFSFDRSDQTLSGWNVVTGDNGSGKTALLKAIALAVVGPEVARSLQPSLTGWIHQDCRDATIAVQLVAGPMDRFTGGRRFEGPFWAELSLERDSKGLVTLKSGQKFLRGKRGPTRGPWLSSPEGWFCVGYGPFRRLYGHSPEAQRLMSTRGKVSRFATLFREDATLAEGDLWLRDLKYRELSGDMLAKQTFDIVFRLLNAEFLQNGIEVATVNPDGLMLKQADGTTLPLEQMSDGYRSAIATLIDIIRQLIDVFGPRGFEPDPQQPRIEHSGLVLVDEVDAHLHPAWQRVIGDWFKRVLPNVQFLVTSHSPLICQAASELGIYHLPNPGSPLQPFRLAPLDYQKVVAGRPNDIYLGPAFGLDHTRSPRAVDAREQFAKLQAKKRSTQLSFAELEQEKQLSLFISAEPDEKSPPGSA